VPLSVMVTTTSEEAYAQGTVYLQELGEDHQPLVSEVLNRLQNETADRLMIMEEGRMLIIWEEEITTTAPDGTVFEVTQETTLNTPHNYTIENGYTYRDNTIYKPDGSELFASE
jgi:hypothetical protein